MKMTVGCHHCDFRTTVEREQSQTALAGAIGQKVFMHLRDNPSHTVAVVRLS